MTTTELLQIDPSELRFVFELKKQSSCLIQLGNNNDHYIAFKVKTTSPKKYCVRPNIGLIKPNEKCDFTVTMQAQRTAPPDMNCKDKFLILSTVVPFGTTDDDITSDMFVKDSGKYIEEKKLKVVLISPPSSPVLLPVNGDVKQDPSYQINALKDRVISGIENVPPPPLRASVEVKGLEPVMDMGENKTDGNNDVRHAENESDMKPTIADDVQLNLAKGCEELKSRLCLMDTKLREAEVAVMKLNEEKRTYNKEKDMLKKELEALKRRSNTKVQQGFPLLFVCMVAIVGVAVGYYIQP
ncbi:vesicle-associated protein 2-2-like isoform X2 [Vicia villosa]|uniref:vesicle-associated protein 2-2-like isoform X2 n=1 Tax=Vicia villosa TaxID=3911 RepID=UPI00273AB889|nr:vesicle-associated protein 2-2-like isoform X2 [Vicia villosa]